MCGIIAVVRPLTSPGTVSAEEPLAQLGTAAAILDDRGLDGLDEAAAAVEAADGVLRGPDGVELLSRQSVADSIGAAAEELAERVAAMEAGLDSGEGPIADGELERVNAAVVRCKDALWAIRRDRLRCAAGVTELAGPGAGRAAVTAYLSIQEALSALDRLEVRGRDSAGLEILVRGHGLDLSSPAVVSELTERSDRLGRSGSVTVTAEGPDAPLSFFYKAAAEIGELGDNTRVLRRAIAADKLLGRALAAEGAEAVVAGHTRWASIGIISEPNAHPLEGSEQGRDNPFTAAVLNGDVDNFADLKASDGLAIAPEITTDAKVIPALVARRLAAGDGPDEAFRSTVNRLEGSVAIAAVTGESPSDLLLALRGSGQALYVGLADGAWVVASEPYGVVEVTGSYLRMDGERPADPSRPAATRGQVIALDGRAAGSLDGIRRFAYDGTALPVSEAEITTAPITTRDIDRGDYPHFLLKEISEAPASFRKTLRGKLIDTDDGLAVTLGDEALPASVREGLHSGRIRRVLAIGQGTAAVAGQALALALRETATDLRAEAVLATELSGFDLAGDMSDTLVVAISQSGTTTDTNRTVDLVRARGAAVVAIVNRRGSDLTDKADGVLYTSDGRDVEMSVASTKAFYSQVAAGFLLAAAIGEAAAGAPCADAEMLAELRRLPGHMQKVLEARDSIGEAARRLAPSRRSWAMVGNGPNRIAAGEVRIKASELCYKSIACDGTEDKKHIDLSAEPLVLVCAAGLSGSTADDVAKEVAIYRAHSAAPVVVANEGEDRFGAALALIEVPATHRLLAFVLSAVAGHLFAYEAALAIDAQAVPLREGRAAIEAVAAAVGSDDGTPTGDELLAQLRPALEPVAARFLDGLRVGDYDGHLEASTAVRLTSLLRFSLGSAPLESYQLEHGKVGTPSVVIEDLAAALTAGIEELTRPIDAIKHQAKTVTVGISRSDEGLLQTALVREVIAAGVARDRLSYEALRTLAALEPLVGEVTGYTRYRIDGDPAVEEEPTAVVIDRSGLGRELRSRTEDHPVLRGTKRRVAADRQVLLARGASDGRTVLIVPEVKDRQATGITLLHVSLRGDLDPNGLRSVLSGYRDRYRALRDAVLETEPVFRDDLLADVEVTELFCAPIHDLAGHWRTVQ